MGLEPVQCPTLFNNGYGGHDIQGIGDKHVAWIHNVNNNDVIVTVLTDAIDRYCSVMAQMTSTYGRIDETEAAVRLVSIFHTQKTDWILEGTREARARWHNLKYYTWVEQQGKGDAPAVGSGADNGERKPSLQQQKPGLRFPLRWFGAPAQSNDTTSLPCSLSTILAAISSMCEL